MLFISGDPSPSSDSSNRLVERLGVTYYHIHVPTIDKDRGLTVQGFGEAVREWRRRRGWGSDSDLEDEDEDDEEESDMDISDGEAEEGEGGRRERGRASDFFSGNAW